MTTVQRQDSFFQDTQSKSFPTLLPDAFAGSALCIILVILLAAF